MTGLRGGAEGTERHGSSVDPAAPLVHPPGLLVRRTSHSVVALADDGSPMVLEDEAVEVWEAFGEPATVTSVAATLAARHPHDAEVDVDVHAFVRELVARGLLAVADASPPPGGEGATQGG